MHYILRKNKIRTNKDRIKEGEQENKIRTKKINNEWKEKGIVNKTKHYKITGPVLKLVNPII